MNHKRPENYLVLLLSFVMLTCSLVACGGMEESAGPLEEAAGPAEEPSEEEAVEVVETVLPIEPTADSSVVSLKEALAEIDAQLSNTLQGNIAHSAPSQMEVDETAEVTLLVSPSMSSEDLAAEISPGGAVKTATINITPWLQAELVSPDPDAFDIRPLHGDATQPLSTVEPTQWTWLVTAQEEGGRNLLLIISRLVEVDGRESWRRVEEYRYPIEVNITFGTRLSQVFSGLWDFKWWISGIVFPIIAYWIIRRLDRPRVRDDSENHQ